MSEQRFYGKGNPVLEDALVACVQWAWRTPEMRETFERDTGLRTAQSPVEAAIDQATGYDERIAEAFTKWVIENVWGEESA